MLKYSRKNIEETVYRNYFGFVFSVSKEREKARALWEEADINRINRENIVIPCPYCNAEESEFVYRHEIVGDYRIGMFDENNERLRELYGLYPQHTVPNKYRSLRTKYYLKQRSGYSYVDYRRCTYCDLIFQNFPHTVKGKQFYYKELYRSLDQVSAGGNQAHYGRGLGRLKDVV